MSQTRKVRFGNLKKNDLGKFGYRHVKSMSVKDRHSALTKAVGAYGALSVFRKLNVVYILTRKKTVSASKIFLQDRDWIKATFF
jgi:hypothetical protein